MVGAAAVAAQMHTFKAKAIGTANDGAYVEGAAQVVHEYGERERGFVCNFAVARFLLQVNVAFEPEASPSAERLVKVNHLRLVFSGKALAFGEFHPFGIGLEFTFCAGHVVAQL